MRCSKMFTPFLPPKFYHGRGEEDKRETQEPPAEPGA